MMIAFIEMHDDERMDLGKWSNYMVVAPLDGASCDTALLVVK